MEQIFSNMDYQSQAPKRHSETLQSLLAAVMVADKKLHKNEISELLAAMDAFDGAQKENENREWLKQNIQQINTILHGPNRQRWLALQFLKLRDYDQKDEALDRLWRVAVADGELHDNEAAIIDKALWLWRQ